MKARGFFALFGFILIFVGLLPSITQQSLLGLAYNYTNLPNVPSSILLDVPFYAQNLDYLYLNPDGLCRFASRQMIIAYWRQKGFISGVVPSQKDLVVEEKTAPYLETKHAYSFIKRGFYVEDGYPWDIDIIGEWYGGWQFRYEGDLDIYVHRIKYYLACSKPLFFALFVIHGIPTLTSPSVPNHAVVLVGYNQTGFFYHNPRSPDDPTNGPNKFIENTILYVGIKEHWWHYQLAFPKFTAPLILTRIQITNFNESAPKVASSFWENNAPIDKDGYVTIHVLATGSPIAIGYSEFPKEDEKFATWRGDSFVMIYPWATKNNLDPFKFPFYKYGVTFPLELHDPEPIPDPPPPPPPSPPDSDPPLPPLPPDPPQPPEPERTQPIWWLIGIGGFFVLLSLPMEKRKMKRV